MPRYLHKYKQILKPYVSRWVHCYSSCPSGMVTDTITAFEESYLVESVVSDIKLWVPIKMGITHAESRIAELYQIKNGYKNLIL